MKSCKYCQSEHTHKCGINKSGSQRYYCRECKRYYTPKPTPKAGVYPPEMHKKVAEMYIDGLNLRRIGRQMRINHQTVANWINKLTKKIDPEQAPIPELGEWDTVELDELYTFVGQKKQNLPCNASAS